MSKDKEIKMLRERNEKNEKKIQNVCGMIEET